MEASGCGVVRIRAVTIRKKGDEEEGSSVGEDVLSARPSSTVAFADLFAMVKSASRTKVATFNKRVRTEKTTISSTGHSANPNGSDARTSGVGLVSCLEYW